MTTTPTLTPNAEPGHMTLATAFQQLPPQWVRLPKGAWPETQWVYLLIDSGWLIFCRAVQNLTTGEITHTPVKVDELPLFNPATAGRTPKRRV